MAAQSNPQTQQFLSNVLSQRGPSALPYTEDVKWLIRQHLLALTSTYPSLIPKTALFTHNDGRSVNLLQADGTLPTPFNGVVYNIPVVIWLLDSYPRNPPAVYLNPTRDMLVKRGHRDVDSSSGMVRVPYLSKWVYPASNLVDLARNLIIGFSRDPPLYSHRRSNSSPNPNPNPNPTNAVGGVNSYRVSNGVSGEGSGQMGSGNLGRPLGSLGGYPASPYTGGGRAGVVQRTDDPNEVFKRNAINKLMEMVHGDLVVMRKSREDEMDGIFNAQGALREREGVIRKGVEEMMDEKEGLEQQLQVVLMNCDVVESWLRENGAKMASTDGDDVDGVFEPCDALSKQMLECTASDLAIEDVIYSLDKAVLEGTVPFDQYLRNVRLLSREQFIHRATSAKVRAAQTQAHIAAMAARASQYVT
ncbi:hypothetical protein Droror1_Dr00016705 [Drosera rotundifolia]